MNKDEEKILGVFDTKAEADEFGLKHKVSFEEGLEYCFSSLFFMGVPQGDTMRIHDYYNIDYSSRVGA